MYFFFHQGILQTCFLHTDTSVWLYVFHTLLCQAEFTDDPSLGFVDAGVTFAIHSPKEPPRFDGLGISTPVGMHAHAAIQQVKVKICIRLEEVNVFWLIWLIDNVLKPPNSQKANHLSIYHHIIANSSLSLSITTDLLIYTAEMGNMTFWNYNKRPPTWPVPWGYFTANRAFRLLSCA